MQITDASSPIAVLGAGSWGTALALYLSRLGNPTYVWSIDPTEIDAMIKDRMHQRYLPNIRLPDTLFPHQDLQHTLSSATDVLIAVPSVGFRQTLIDCKPFITPKHRFICATKGLDEGSGKLLSEVALEVLGDKQPYAVLSGPSFAKEVAHGLPCAVDIASKDAGFLKDLVKRFHSPLFCVQTRDDVTGVEISGVMKNVIAILAGIADGLKLGASARSALITLGLGEIQQLGMALGAEKETFSGLAAMGDLILTCSDNLSRNRRLGLAIGEGTPIDEAEKNIGQIVEGKRNAALVQVLAKQHKLHLPLCQTVYDILEKKVTLTASINTLLFNSFPTA